MEERKNQKTLDSINEALSNIDQEIKEVVEFIEKRHEE